LIKKRLKIDNKQRLVNPSQKVTYKEKFQQSNILLLVKKRVANADLLRKAFLDKGRNKKSVSKNIA
jgi:hypothetical protein